MSGNPPISDNEVFMATSMVLSLEEVKRQLFVEKRNTISSAQRLAEDEDYSKDTSLKLPTNQTRSEPELLAEVHCTLVDSSDSEELGDSICEIFSSSAEEDKYLKNGMLSNPCLDDSNNEDTNISDLDNTLDIIDQILKNGPPSDQSGSDNIPKQTILINRQTDQNVDQLKIKTAEDFFTPPKENVNVELESFKTPSAKLQTIPIINTPANPAPSKKPISSTKKTPLKNTYQHIRSPVAAYIKESPQVPLLVDVRPKKPLHYSSVPKPMQNTAQVSLPNKKNVALPCVAYKSAKETKIIDVPDQEKLPKSNWPKNVLSAIPRPVVIKHKTREIKSTNKSSKFRPTEDSLDDLSLHQADVSVCTQQSAYKNGKN